jgi:hypothetical protein
MPTRGRKVMIGGGSWYAAAAFPLGVLVALLALALCGGL